MKCIVYIALVVLVGTVAVQGITRRRYFRHRMYHHDAPRRFHHGHLHGSFMYHRNDASNTEGHDRSSTNATTTVPPTDTEASSEPSTAIPTTLPTTVLTTLSTVIPTTVSRTVPKTLPTKLKTKLPTKKSPTTVPTPFITLTTITPTPTKTPTFTNRPPNIHSVDILPEDTSTSLPSPTTEAPPQAFTPRPLRTVASTSESTSTETLPPITTWRPKIPPRIITETTPAPDTTISMDEGPPTISPDILRCIESCRVTPEFDPVCGTDGVTYENEGRLFCVKECGIDISIRRKSLCPPPVFEENFEGGPPEPPPTPPPTPPPSPPPTIPEFLARATPLSAFHRCMRQCPLSADFTPVCGTDTITYMNMDRLRCAQSCGDDVQVLCEKPCAVCGVHPVSTSKPKTTTSVTTTSISSGRLTSESEVRQCMRSCPVTTEYNPICGSNRVTYNNPGHLLCAQSCGVDVTVARFSPCYASSTTTTTEFPLTYDELNCIRDCRVTAVYNPVCGTDNLTYINIGHLECARYCGLDVDLKTSFRCAGDLDFPTEPTEITQSPTTRTINREKDQIMTSTKTISTTSTTTTTTSKPTSTSTPIPTSSSTLGFAIPLKILDDIFGLPTNNQVPLTTTPPPTTTTTTERTTTEVDEDIDLDARFGKEIKDKDDYSRIIFPE